MPDSKSIEEILNNMRRFYWQASGEDSRGSIDVTQAAAQLNRLLEEAKVGWANEFIKKEAYPYGDEGPEWAAGWNAYRNKALAERAKLKRKLKKDKQLG